MRAADHIQEMFGHHDNRAPLSALHTDRPSCTEYYILSAEEETPEQLGGASSSNVGLLGVMGDRPVVITLPPGLRARGCSRGVVARRRTELN